MKILIVWESRETENSKTLADAVFHSLKNSFDCVFVSSSEAPLPDEFDFIIPAFGIYHGFPDENMCRFMQKCHKKEVGLIITSGAAPDSTTAFRYLGRAEGLLKDCVTKCKFLCQGRYTTEHLDHMKSLPPNSPHGWTPERAARVMEAMKHPNAEDCKKASELFYQTLIKRTGTKR